MATKQAVNKTQAVRDYLNAHPVAASEIVAALDERGIKVTPSYVAAIKTQINKITVPPTVEIPADRLTLDQVKMVAQAIKRIRLRWRASGTLHR